MKKILLFLLLSSAIANADAVNVSQYTFEQITKFANMCNPNFVTPPGLNIPKIPADSPFCIAIIARANTGS